MLSVITVAHIFAVRIVLVRKKVNQKFDLIQAKKG
jgi:hypothetical protein